MIDFVTQFWRRFRALWHRDELDRDLADEMQFHLRQRTEQHIGEGMNPQAAHRAAHREFGNLTLLHE